jgi:hypothetical protein
MATRKPKQTEEYREFKPGDRVQTRTKPFRKGTVQESQPYVIIVDFDDGKREAGDILFADHYVKHITEPTPKAKAVCTCPCTCGAR